jgi:hypothetical protein
MLLLGGASAPQNFIFSGQTIGQLKLSPPPKNNNQPSLFRMYNNFSSQIAQRE